ncbi:MAG: hypothetical protein J5767_11950 [Paludibacteraceae bacterium]|nr:hypothetical protein [Paludibacteraceae bacterium]
MATNMECSAQTVSGKINGHEYVDLGLPSGLKWATQNIGATKPSDDGDYFAWGDKESGYSFSCDQYKWSDRKSSHEPIDFYNVDNIDLFQITKYGEKDGKTTLEAADDAARTLWGAPWRMPTVEELQELSDGCQWVYMKSGFKGTSKYNGATIFIPTGTDGGHRSFFEEQFMTVEFNFVCATLWSSSRASTEWDAQYFMLANDFPLHENDSVSGGVGMKHRYYGIPIRAVSQ